MIHSSYEIDLKYVEENVQGREFQESHKGFSGTFKRKVVGIEKLFEKQNLNIKIMRDFNVAKCFKGGEIFLNNALN